MTTSPRQTTSPALSLVLVAGSGWRGVSRTLAHLRTQTIRDRIEVLVVCDDAGAPAAHEIERHPFHSLRVVHSGPITERGAAAALGVLAARGDLVGLVEDHAFAAPTCAERLVEAHEGPWAGVGPTVGNANPGSATSWVNYLLAYGAFATPSSGERPIIPWHNSVYKRSALAPFRDRLGPLLEWEGELQRAMVDAGARLYHAGDATTLHLNVSRPASSLRLNRCRGRILGALRAERERWPTVRRVLYACAFALYPWFQLRALLPMLRTLPVPASLRVRVRLALVANVLAMSVGEALGVLLGVGDAVQRLEHFELHRPLHVRDGERDLMYTPPVPAAAAPERAMAEAMA